MLISFPFRQSIDQPLDVERVHCDQYIIVRVESPPFHTRIQLEESFDDTLHLRSVVRHSCGADVKFPTLANLH